ncbi:uncharacterized protein B0I36DRAFT_354865 [Microdochium trichocladiopsis]|uniref:Apple domain-containing protein n=1 Tax=Microdochium trichocladiopsis TaxID=1682393 RepID=A0A9P8XUH4_9PEZI|nr:uncharacterized protein B0I36DRAFT_354865 [Microdochium trichocladiopsis]KAH7018605.1 hypothetical protein B0I36DRAFT_354865 [Microdochium trichocladiopsis]
MLQITLLMGGLAAFAQAAALQSIPAAALFSRAQSPINCGPFPGKGPSEGTTYVSASGKSYKILCNAERGAYSGWYYAQGSFPTAESCIDACAAGAVQGCVYASWNNQGAYCALATNVDLTGNGYEYNTIGGTYIKTLNCKDGSSDNTVWTTPAGKYQILCNYQYGGTTLGASKRAETFEQCVGFCDSTNGCVDVVYSEAKYCWLKSSKTNGYKSPGWYTAIKVPDNFQPAKPDDVTPVSSSQIGAINCFDNSADGTTFKAASGNSYDIACNYQYDGDTIDSIYTRTFEDCANLCDTTDGCIDAVWSKANYCWMKSSKTGTGYKSPNWFSAIRK